MFDSLNRHMISPYAEGIIDSPNFKRLAEKSLTFDKFYAGSLPCMPARREMHTGRYNFLHRGWGPLEPYEDSMPEILDRNGVHTHLASDHLHYWEDGGATYHTRYTTWEFFRGKQGDPWKGVVENNAKFNYQQKRKNQDHINRSYMPTEDLHYQTLTFDAGLHFLETNVGADDWLLQVETFDPHEPFFTYQNYLDQYPFKAGDEDPGFDHPPYGKVAESPTQIESAERHYKALVSQCDKNVGRILDFMDEHDMWRDTMLILNTDHGFLLGEHGFWAKGAMPWYDELIHLPFFFHDPRNPQPGERTEVLAQTIDIAPTLLSFFGKEIPNDMQGQDLALALGRASREGGLFGVHSGHVSVTDGRFVYMRSCVSADNTPLEEYTLMPSHMTSLYSAKELSDWQPAEPFKHTKGLRTMQIKGESAGWFSPWRYGTLLFDTLNDPRQENPIVDDEIELKMAKILVTLMNDTDAPSSQYERIGLPQNGIVNQSHLLARQHQARAILAVEPMPPLADIPTALSAPLAQIISDPIIRPIIAKHLPAALNTEFLNSSRVFNLVGATRASMIPSSILKEIIKDYREVTAI